MTKRGSGGRATNGIRRNSVALSAARWLALAASPTFAAMALLTGVLTGGHPGMGGASATMSPLSGMVTMYVLMSVFHAGAWLNLLQVGRAPAGPPMSDDLSPLRSARRLNAVTSPVSSGRMSVLPR